MEYEFDLTPIAKPRMTQRDKWLNPPRKEVLKYRIAKKGMEAYSLMHKFTIKDKIDCTFVLPMPPSWSEKKRKNMDGKPHENKPDIDNLIKFVMDTMLPNGDQMVHTIYANKVWGREGKIIFREDTTHEN